MSDDIIIKSLSFNDDYLEITYVEARDQTKKVVMVRTLLVDLEAIEDHLEELVESIQDVLDAALVVMRNPPKKLSLFGKAEDDGEEE